MIKAISGSSILLALLAIFCIPENVFAQIAPGVQQSAAQTATITGTVLQSDGKPVSGADVRLNGTGAHLTTVSDAHGTFAFTSVPYGVYRIDAIAMNLGAASRQDVVLKGDTAITIQYLANGGATGLKEIARVSTGSAGANINVTPASVASVRPSDYAFQGNSSWQQLLSQIPGVTVGGGIGLDAGRGGFVGIPGNPFAPIVLSINGALPYETSTTLDGMPLTNASFSSLPGGGTDLSFLPMPSFDTSDVVRGPGANAPSILDSIGGSFVLHAPGQVSGNHVDFSVSNDPYGGIFSNMKIATRIGRLSSVIVYGMNNSPGPLGDQSVITSFPVFTFNTLNGQPFQCTPNGCLQFDASPSYAPNANFQNCSCAISTSLLFCCVPNSTAWTQHSGSIGLSYDFPHNVTAQLFYAGSSSTEPKGLETQFPVDFEPGPGYTGSIAPGFHNFPDAFGPSTTKQASSLLEEKVTAYIGRGILRLAALQDNSFFSEKYNDIIPDGQYTVWGTGFFGSSAPGTPFIFNGTPGTFSFIQDSFTDDIRDNNRSYILSYAMQAGPKLNLGVSYVKSYYNNPQTSVDSFAGFPFTIEQPSAASETTTEVRLNAGLQLSSRLSLDGSWYFANGSYHVKNPLDPSGNTYLTPNFPYSAPRVSAVWQASRDVAVRVAAGGGYALIPLTYLATPNAVFLVGPFFFQLTPNLNLKPEDSFGFDVGTDVRFHRDTVLSFDLYRTNLRGQYYQSSMITNTNFNGTGLPLFTQQYGNLSQSRYEGLNMRVRHDVPRGIYWNAGLGLTRAYVVSVPAGFYDSPLTGPNSVNTCIIPGINFNGAQGVTSTVPYANGSAQIGYRWSPEKYFDLTPTYYGNGNSYFEPAFLEFDAHAGYPLSKSVSLIAIFRNITGIHDQNFQVLFPNIGAPTVAGKPFPLFGVPFGPRTVTVTANFHL